MLNQTFLFLPGIGSQTEQLLWSKGITNWDQFIKTNTLPTIAPLRKHWYNQLLLEAAKKLNQNNATFFSRRLPQSEHWRLYPHFKQDTIYLDIETTGLSKHSIITLIGLYNGEEFKPLLKHANLTKENIQQAITNTKLLITFNGASFDLPMIHHHYPNTIPSIPHLDLRHLCKQIGLTGGLKSIEKQLGIKRKNHLVEQLYGGDAVLLWRKYCATEDEHYLKLLIEYNQEDVINLETILEHCISHLKKNLPLYRKD